MASLSPRYADRTLERMVKYEGEIDSKGVPHGQGKATYKNGETYKGDVRHGTATGWGMICFTLGGSYTGSVLDGRPHGWGEKVYPSEAYAPGTGQTRSGYWADGAPVEGPVGIGSRPPVAPPEDLRQRRQIYQGEVNNKGLAHGEGVMTYANGACITGTWCKGSLDLKGSLDFKPSGRVATVVTNRDQPQGIVK